MSITGPKLDITCKELTIHTQSSIPVHGNYKLAQQLTW